MLRAAWQEVVAALGAGRLVIGGKSMGGRIASMMADELGVRGLVCLGYPFHAPGKPLGGRADHLEAIATPTLIVQGQRDPFGTRDDIAGYALGRKVKLHFLMDGDHSFRPRKKNDRNEAENLAEAVAEVVAFMKRIAAS